MHGGAIAKLHFCQRHTCRNVGPLLPALAEEKCSAAGDLLLRCPVSAAGLGAAVREKTCVGIPALCTPPKPVQGRQEELVGEREKQSTQM